MRTQSGTHLTNDRDNKVRVAPYRRQGHLDALASRPFHQDYDKWNRYEQIAYERGRLYSLNANCATLETPEWKPGVVRPRGYVATLRLADRMIGSPLPGKHMDAHMRFNTDHLIPIDVSAVY